MPRVTKLAVLLIALGLFTAACSDPFAGDDSVPNATIANSGSAEEADPAIVQEYFVEIGERDAVRTLSPQLALERLSLGADLLASSVPQLKSCATQEVQDDLDLFEQGLPDIVSLALTDDEFVGAYGYGIGLLSYYDLAIQAADPLRGAVGVEDAYVDCDLGSLEDPTVTAQLAAIDAVLAAESFLAVAEDLQPQLGDWRSCLDASPAESELVAFPGFEDLEMMARATFEDLSAEYFEVLSQLVTSGVTYDDLLGGTASLENVDAELIQRLADVQAEEVLVAGYDQACFDEHVAAEYEAASDAELQRLQRDWPNL